MRPNPLTDELTDEARAALSVIFRRMRAQFCNYDVEQQRFQNKVWHLTGRRNYL